MTTTILFGTISGLAILIGALMGLYLKLSNRLIATFMAFGSGVLISALSIDMMNDGFESSHSPIIISVGFLLGALVFVGGDYLIDTNGGFFRRQHQATAALANKETSGSGLAILLGTLLDGIPESFVLGASLAKGGNVGFVFVIAVFISNLPEGMSGTVGMKMGGMSTRRIMTLWLTTLLITVLSAMGGYRFLGDAPAEFHSFVMSFASGAILAMLSDTMIPEAFRYGGRFVALITSLGFLLAFLLTKLL